MKSKVALWGITFSLIFGLALLPASLASANGYIDPGPLLGDSDIIWGVDLSDPGDDFPTLGGLGRDFRFDMEISSDAAQFFLWGDTPPVPFDGLFIRTIHDTSQVFGTFDVTLSTDLFTFDYEDEPYLSIRPASSDLETGLNQGTISWDFSGTDRRILGTLMDVDPVGPEPTEFDDIGIAVIRVEEEPLFRVIALSSPFTMDTVLNGDTDPQFDLLGAWNVSELGGEYSLNLGLESQGYLYVIIHNWSTSEFVLDDAPLAQFVSENFDELLETLDQQPDLFLVQPSSMNRVGSGISTFITPYEIEELNPAFAGILVQTPIMDLDGEYVVYFTPPGDDDDDLVFIPDQIIEEPEPMVFTWGKSDDGGCSALGFIPGSLLILLPLLILLKRK